MKTTYVYIMAGQKDGTLTIGVTNDLIRRVWEYKNDRHCAGAWRLTGGR